MFLCYFCWKKSTLCSTSRGLGLLPTTSRLLRKFVSQNQKIGLNICQSCFAYRDVPQETTGFSPFEFLYECWMRGLLDVLRQERTRVDWRRGNCCPCCHQCVRDEGMVSKDLTACIQTYRQEPTEVETIPYSWKFLRTPIFKDFKAFG